jgi:3-deoxy-D-manno-octulosonate 8-phosphate phosphatase (KDO 8-P phosphatase)
MTSQEAADEAVLRARKIKVLIFDVDGVLTDGQIYIIPGPDGKGIEMKGFTAHDGLGISLARLGGLRIGIITLSLSSSTKVKLISSTRLQKSAKRPVSNSTRWPMLATTSSISQ